MYIFGSFVTAKATPADVDLFLVMSGDFAAIPATDLVTPLSIFKERSLRG